MDAGKKVTLMLSAQALEALSAHATERKRGEFVSAAILEWARRREPQGGITERMESRLIRIEDMLAQLAGGKG